MNQENDPQWLRSWARAHRRFSVHFYGVRSYYWAQLRAARMEARADRLEGLEPKDPVAEAAAAVGRVYDAPLQSGEER